MIAKYMKALPAAVLLLLAGNLHADVDLTLGFTIDANGDLRVDPGQETTYRYVYRASAPVDARLIQTVPAGARLVRWDDSRWSCTRERDSILCTSRVDVQTRTLKLTVAAPDDLAGGVFHELARLESDQPDPKPYDNQQPFDLTVNHLLTVMTPADFGAGSLRDAIARVNDECSGTPPCHVVFAEPMRIAPRTPLPAITGCHVLIDGGAYQANTPNRSLDRPRRVEISGEDAGLGDGLVIAGQCGYPGNPPVLQGLAIHSFAGNGVSVVDPAQAGVVLAGCSITENVRGLSVDAANGRGDAFNCLIAGNARSGVAYWRGLGGFLEGNLIGVDFGGVPRANGASGIYVAAGLVASWYNAIEYNKDFGAAVSLSGAAFYSQGDYIALNGGIAIDWGLDGPTAFDAGGLMPPVPRLFTASYDPAGRRTVIAGVIPMDANTPRDSYLVVATLAARDFDGGIAKGSSALMRGNGSDLPFRIEIPGDLRGQTITVRSARIVYSDNSAGDSEFSAGIVVR